MTGRFLLQGVVFYLIGAGLSFITSQAPAPENSTTHFYSWITLLVFFLFLSSIFSFGAWIRNYLRLPFFSDAEDALFDLSVGVCFFYLAAYLLTVLGLFSSGHRFFLWAVLATGFALGAKHVQPRRWFYFGDHWVFKLFAAIPVALVVLKVVEGFQIIQHGDAYITYLPAPRTWATSGGFKIYPQFTEFFLTTSWESLYAWGTALCGFTGSAGLDLSQRFSQWTTGGIAVLGLVFAFHAFARRLYTFFPVALQWHPIAVIAGIQVPALQWTANLAKNDLGAAFLAISSFYFSQFASTRAALLLAGILCGAAVIAKLPLVVFGLIIFLSLSFKQETRSKIGWFILGGLIGITPILIRNFTLTSNPVFPWLSSIFPTPNVGISAAQGGAHATTMGFQLASLPLYIKEFFQQIPLFICVLPIILFRKQWKQILIPIAALIAFTIVLRPATEVRYQNAPLLFLGFFGAYYVFYLIERIPNTAVKKWGGFIPALYVIATSNMSFFTFTQYKTRKFELWPTRITQLYDVGSEGKLWIRNNLKPENTILVVGDGYVYYLIDYKITQYSHYRNIEQAIADKKPEEALAILKTMDFNYLYLADDADYVVYRPVISQLMSLASASWNISCNRYTTAHTQVWDLACLKDSK